IPHLHSFPTRRSSDLYHGPEGISAIAGKIHQQTKNLAAGLDAIGYKQLNKTFFDTLLVDAGKDLEAIKKNAVEAGILFNGFEVRSEEHTSELQSPYDI